MTQILANDGPLPRDLVTRKSLENAAAVVAATGGSTNAVLHLPAIAHEAGLRFVLDDIAQVFARTPLIGDLRPEGAAFTACVRGSAVGPRTASTVWDVSGLMMIQPAHTSAVPMRTLVRSVILPSTTHPADK